MPGQVSAVELVKWLQGEEQVQRGWEDFERCVHVFWQSGLAEEPMDKLEAGLSSRGTAHCIKPLQLAGHCCAATPDQLSGMGMLPGRPPSAACEVLHWPAGELVASQPQCRLSGL